MILVKKILGFLGMLVVLGFWSSNSVGAQWVCTDGGLAGCTPGGSCTSCIADQSCSDNNPDTPFACCNGTGQATGDPNNPCFCNLECNTGPTPVPPTPTPYLNAFVQGRYRLQPGNVPVSENYSGFGAGLQVTLDSYLVGGDVVVPHDITQGGGYGTALDKYTSAGNVDWRLLYPPLDTWAVRLRVPAGYSAGYTVSYNNTSNHGVTYPAMVPNFGNRLQLNEQAMMDSGSGPNRFADVYWHLCKNEAPGGLVVNPEYSCNQSGPQTVRWDRLGSAVSYSLRIDDGDRWTGDANGDGKCDFQGKNPKAGVDDYCVDNIPTTTNPSYVIPGGLPSGKTYRIWVHAINQCGGGTTVSTQITYDRMCPTDTPTPEVSCQNLTLSKNGKVLTEPYTGKIALGDKVDYTLSVKSAKSLESVVYLVSTPQGSKKVTVPAFCPTDTENVYSAQTSLVHSSGGRYQVKYLSAVYGTRCVPAVTIAPHVSQ